ncbi:hypothetical protein AAF712_009955 [Marasmius tenuissimus]|uniref:Uncharacterized protein n=1 Tax=Marasmius tenuissimus TaxID=585030 RepID=A0ABR2ZNN3_9AGAR
MSSSTRTTIPGLGYLSGKAIKRLGEAVLNGVDNVVVNRQLGRIEASVKTDNAWHEDTPSPEVKQMCRVLLEFSHPEYPFSIRTRALRVIMTLIGSMKFIGLAAALVNLNSMPQTQTHLYDVLDCLWDSKLSENAFKREAEAGDEATRKKISALRSAGYESYVASSPQAHTSILLLSSPFVLYLTLIAVLGDTKYTHIILSEQLDIVRFLRFLGLFDENRGRTDIVAGRLFMQVLQLRLAPTPDDDESSLKTVVKNAISSVKREVHGHIGVLSSALPPIPAYTYLVFLQSLHASHLLPVQSAEQPENSIEPT